MNGKRIILMCLVLGLLLVGGVMVMARSGNYSLSWTSVDGGGGYLSSGDYALLSTAGQADAGNLSNGPYTSEGGFMIPAGSATATLHYLPVLTNNS